MSLPGCEGPEPTTHADEPGLARYRVPSLDAADAQPAIDAARAAGAQVVALVPQRERLEELFMKAVTDPATGRPPPPGAGA